MKKIILTSIFLASLIFSASPCFSETKKLTIIFTGDARGELENCHCPKDDFGGLERRSNYIKEVKGEAGEILLLDVGDVMPLFSPEFTIRAITYNSFISLKAMDLLGYDAMNAGESDLILGEKFLQGKSRNLKFPVLSSNITYKSNSAPVFKPYLIKTMKNGLKVGVIGLTNERYIVNSKNLEVLSHKEMAAKYIGEIRDLVDVVIVLAHVGLPYSEELADSVSGIDVILSGHWDAETQEPKKAARAIIMPSVSHSRLVGRLGLEIEANGVISSYEWQSIPLDAKYEGNSFIKKLVLKMPSLKKERDKKPFEITRKLIHKENPRTPLRVIVFYAAGCKSCVKVERDVLPGIEEKYGERILIEKYDIGIPGNYTQMARLEKLYGSEDGYVPEIIVSGYVLMGEEKIRSDLGKVIEKVLLEPSDLETSGLTKEDIATYQAPRAAESLILSRFESFSPYAVAIAGFLDGINPCAFTTMVFFISFLAFIGYRKREMIFAGSFFTTGVFIAYFLIGMGIFRFLRSLEAFNYLTLVINILIGVLAFCLGVLSVVDYFKFRKTKDVNFSLLQLPQSIKNRIHSVIGRDFRHKKKALLRIAWVAFTAGFMVSILESICTGQVYLPTIAYVMRMPNKHLSAFSYLLIYNAAFITPLLMVFILGLFGATSSVFAKFMQKHFGFVKLSIACLFFALAIALVIFK